MTKHNDGTKGWEGSGIDQEDGLKWVRRQVDKDALKDFGFQLHDDASSEKVVCDYDSEGASPNKLLENARPGGSKPLMGKGSPSDPIQTGDRWIAKKHSGAF